MKKGAVMKNFNYHGNRKPYAAVLCHSGDRETVEPVLAEIEKQGLRLCLIDENTGKAGSRLKKACGVICVLTENFSSSETLQSGILQAEAAGKSVIPVRTDGFDLPDFIKRMTYASNSVNISKYTPEKAAERILTAPAFKEPKISDEQKGAYRRGAVLAIAGAVVIAVVAAAPLFREKTIEATPEQTEVIEESQQGISLPEGWDITYEDLLQVSAVFIIGDRVEEAGVHDSIWNFAYSNWEDDRNVFYYIDDDSPVGQGTIQDFSFLAQLPNLTNLVLVNQTAEELPDLSGLRNLNHVELWYCEFKDVEGLRSKSLNFLHISLPDVTDLSPLTDCTNLMTLHCTDCSSLRSLEGLCPPRLTEFQISDSPLEDIGSLSGFSNLTTLELGLTGESAIDLSPLAGCTQLSDVEINAGELSLDLSAFSSMSRLYRFYCRCRAVTNAEGAGRPNLNSFCLELEEGQRVDLGFLASCWKIKELYLGGMSTDLDFLAGMSKTPVDTVSLRGRGFDWADLSALKTVGTLEINAEGGNTEGLSEALSGTEIGSLYLENCNEIKLSAFAKNVENLSIRNSGLSSLEGLAGGKVRGLELGQLNRLTSLNGIEKLDLETLSVELCLHLTDWDALGSVPLKKLEIRNQFNLPDFGSVKFAADCELRLENITGMTDLSCLDSISGETLAKTRFTVKAVGEELTDISALSRFNPDSEGKKRNLCLTVNPIAEGQAQQLVDSGCFSRVETEEPEGDWESAYDDYTILSFEELNTLPDFVLAKIKQLWVVGDSFYEDGGWCDIQDSYGRREYYFYPDNGDEVRVDGMGPVEDIAVLSRLTGLERMILMCQPLESLDGIQNLENLRELTIYGCRYISDYSPVFALGSLEKLRIEGVNITSIEGVQNLYNLRELDIRDTSVSDLSPVGEISFSGYVCEYGFSLRLPGSYCFSSGDMEFLSAVPKFSSLQCFVMADSGWIEYLRGKEVREAELFCLNSTENLEKFVSAVSGLEYLGISWQQGIDDLSCLTECDSLRTLRLSYDMTAAMASLEGKVCGFEIEIDR